MPPGSERLDEPFTMSITHTYTQRLDGDDKRTDKGLDIYFGPILWTVGFYMDRSRVSIYFYEKPYDSDTMSV